MISSFQFKKMSSPFGLTLLLVLVSLVATFVITRQARTEPSENRNHGTGVVNIEQNKRSISTNLTSSSPLSKGSNPGSSPVALIRDSESLENDEGKFHIPYQILDRADASDPESSELMVSKYARTKGERRRLNHAHHCSKRVNAIRIGASFRDLGRKLQAGEPVARVNLPGFDGEDYEVTLTDREFLTDKQGTLFGQVEGLSHSEVVIVYYEDSSTATLAIPTRGIHIEYEPHTEDIMMVYDVDSDKFHDANPCSRCQSSR